MNTLQHIEFNSPWLLLLWLLIPVMLYFWYWKAYNQGGALAWSYVPKDISLRTFKSTVAKWLPLLLVVFYFFAVLALARPQITLKEEELNAEGIDIFLVMDLSSSMLSRDFNPDRLEVSKQVAEEFVQKRIYDRIGLVSFAGEAYTQAPLTMDHELLISLLRGLKVGGMEDGTAIGMGLATAVNRLKDSDSKTKVVILLTDGVNNHGYISPETASEIAQELGVRAYTVGVGTHGFAMSPTGRYRNGNFAFAKQRVQIDDNLLQSIANKTGGSYYRATTKEALQQIYDEIDQLEKTEFSVTVTKRTTEYYYYFMNIAALSLCIFILLKYTLLNIWPE